MNADESKLLQTFVTSQENTNKQVLAELSTIHRGLYGDDKNKTPGLIERQEEDEERISRLEKWNERIMWIWGAVVTLVVGAWELLGDQVKGLFK